MRKIYLYDSKYNTVSVYRDKKKLIDADEPYKTDKEKAKLCKEYTIEQLLIHRKVVKVTKREAIKYLKRGATTDTKEPITDCFVIKYCGV